MRLPSYVFRKKVTQWCDADTAVRKIAKGKRILIGSGGAVPQHLVAALVRNAKHFRDNEIVHLLTLASAPYVEARYARSFRHNALFIGPNVHEAVVQGLADFTPVVLSQIPQLFQSGQMPIDCALIQVSRPDSSGMVSLGISIDILPSAVAAARMVIAQMNDDMPQTCGASRIPLESLDYVVRANEPLCGLALNYPDAVCLKISEHMRRLVRDGDTLQIGIGSLPHAIASGLSDKSDLGLHSEIISDEIMNLCRNGNITNARKGFHDGVSVVSAALGTRSLYGFVDGHPAFHFLPSEYVNNPAVIARNRNMVSINSAFEIDLTGQVCTESMGSRLFSGYGGQMDFIRGARLSKGGRSFMVLPSTANHGSVSRITAQLSSGVGIVTSRAEVDYVVTEYGVAYLHGKTIRERGLALIQIAHPQFRDQLLDHLKQRHYVYADQKAVKDEDNPVKELIPYSHSFKGRRVFFRHLQPCDEKLLQDFFYSHAPETIYARYLREVDSLPHTEAGARVAVDYTKDMAVAGFDSPHPCAKMVCVARYIRQNDAAEMAVVVKEDYQNIGICGFLVQTLIEAARRHRLKQLTASIGMSNLSMLCVVKKAGFTIRESRSVQGYDAVLDLRTQADKSAAQAAV